MRVSSVGGQRRQQSGQDETDDADGRDDADDGLVGCHKNQGSMVMVRVVMNLRDVSTGSVNVNVTVKLPASV